MPESLAEWATWYATHGYPVFPVHSILEGHCTCLESQCDSPGKHPRVPHGVKEATNDLHTIRQWWRENPNSNIGLATGTVSNIFVLDVDDQHGGWDSLQRLTKQNGDLPETPQSLTGGGGIHYCFAHPSKPYKNSIGKLGAGLDVRSDGGYIVAPPSLHFSGKSYIWDLVASIEDIAFAECPSWLLDLCEDATRKTPEPVPGLDIPKGRRESYLVSIGGAMRYRGATRDEILTTLEHINQRCTPPLYPKDLHRIATSVSRYAVEEEIDPPTLKTSRNGTVAPDKKKWPRPTTWNELRQATFPERRWLVRGLIPDGLTIIGGAPKVAKSYAAYDLILATAQQGLALGHFGCEPGPALYMAVEDDQGETQLRVYEVRPTIGEVDGLYFVNATEIPTITEGLCDYVESVVLEHKLSLVVIDPLMYVYDLPSNKKDPFLEMKSALLPFRQLARALQFSMVFVDHQRKTSKDDIDIFQTLYGSRAKEAIADSLIMVSRYENEVRFDCKGRSIKPQVLHFTFTRNEEANTFTWAFIGLGDSMASGTLQLKILQALKDAEIRGRRALNVAGVIDFAEMLATPSTTNKIRQAMFQMYKKGILFRSDEGLFTRARDDDPRGVIV